MSSRMLPVPDALVGERVDAALARMQAAQEREINRFAADAICDFILKEEQVHA